MRNWIRYVELGLLAVIAVVLVIDRFCSAGNGELSGQPEGVINLVEWKQSAGGNGHWYGVIDKEQFWSDAVGEAERISFNGHDGYLATVTTSEENSFIKGRVISQTHQPSILDGFWLGGFSSNGEWKWITGEPFVYENWSLYEPNNQNDETALNMWGPNNWEDRKQPGQWNNLLPNDEINRLHRTWSVIEWGEFDMNAKPVTLDSLIHLQQWTKGIGGNDHWYGIIALELYFDEVVKVAPTFARNGVKGHLATIQSEEENQFVIEHVVGDFRQPCRQDQYWLGGIEEGGRWRWLDGTEWGFENWAPREPNNIGVETAVSMWGPSARIKGRFPGGWNNCAPDDTVNLLGHFFGIVEFDTP